MKSWRERVEKDMVLGFLGFEVLVLRFWVLRFWGFGFPAAGYQLPTAVCRFPVAVCRFPVAVCRLPFPSRILRHDVAVLDHRVDDGGADPDQVAQLSVDDHGVEHLAGFEAPVLPLSIE
jgi:hypothetical protein